MFQDVQVSHAGGRLVVTVVENQVINRVAYEGNKKVKDEQLNLEVQSKARGTFSRPLVQADTQRIVDIYRRLGRFDVTVDPKIIDLPNNRVDLVFEIHEGPKVGVKDIVFVGNHAYSDYRLKDQIKTSESNFLSFLQTQDIYDADRIEADRDLLRRFYLKHGYADVRVVSAVGAYDPAKKGFVVTFTIDEGPQYHVSTVDVISNVHDLDPEQLRPRLKVSAGDVYNAEAVEKSVEDMTVEAARRGYAFATVRPRGDRNYAQQRSANVFVVEEGPRAYIERIDIRGNTRTRDYVIRREFDIAEGDAYNRALVDRAERRLKNLDYFKTVKITNEPGSAPDRVIVNVDVEEQPTGEFSVSGGYSTVGRLPRRGQRRRAQSARPRPVCEGVRAVRPARARLRVVVRRALSARLSAGLRRRHLRRSRPSRRTIMSYDTRDDGRQFALRLRADGRARRCNCAIRSISRRSRCRDLITAELQ